MRIIVCILSLLSHGLHSAFSRVAVNYKVRGSGTVIIFSMLGSRRVRSGLVSHRCCVLGSGVSIGISLTGCRRRSGSSRRAMDLFEVGCVSLSGGVTGSKPFPISRLIRLSRSQGCSGGTAMIVSSTGVTIIVSGGIAISRVVGISRGAHG